MGLNMVPRRGLMKGVVKTLPFILAPAVLNPDTYVSAAQAAPHEGEWRQPTKSEAGRLLANPDFLTRPQTSEGIPLFTNQLDLGQYDDFDFSTFTDEAKEAYIGNACGPAMIATIYKTYFYFKYGSIPDISIERIRQILWDRQFIDVTGYEAPFFPFPGRTLGMYPSAIRPALQILDPVGELFQTVDLTHDFGVRYRQLVPTGEWPDMFEKAHAICNQGGMILLYGLKYGKPGYPAAHFSLMTDAPQKPSGLALFIDPKATPRLNTLESYHQQWEEQPGFLYAFAILPTFLHDTHKLPKNHWAIPV